MPSRFTCIALPLTLLAILSQSGCRPGSQSSNPHGDDTNHRLAITPESAQTLVADGFEWERFVSNDLLHSLKEEANPKLDEIRRISVALPWLQNDQTPALWFGMSRGYFAEAGLEIEIVPGGPGRDNLLRLVSGQVDIAIASCATGVIRMLASDTGGEIVSIAALQKAYPYAYIGIDSSIAESESSTRALTTEDFRQKTLGLTPGSELFLSFALENLGLEREDVQIRKAGASLAPLTSGVFDFYSTMADNNPRKLEAMGHRNWMLWDFTEHGWVDYHNLITVTPQTLRDDPETLTVFLAALKRSVSELLDTPPLEAANEIMPYLTKTDLTPEMVARRLEFQAPITRASPEEDLLEMRVQRWVEAAAILWRHQAISLPTPKAQR